jgi:uncharacterized protein YegL
MAVLAGLYMVKPWVYLLAELTPQQQVQAAVLADMLQLTAAGEAAATLLQVAAGSADSVSAVLDALLGLATVPDCLLPVFQQALLSKYGNLEAVWDPAGPYGTILQNALLGLPLQAMEQLLAADKLKVRAMSLSVVASNSTAACGMPLRKRVYVLACGVPLHQWLTQTMCHFDSHHRSCPTGTG